MSSSTAAHPPAQQQQQQQQQQQDMVPAEEVLARKWDRCLSNYIIKVGAGLSVGVVTSVLLFRKRTWPISLSGGFGLGMAYEQCQRAFDPNVTLNVMKVRKEQ
ncbi:Mitochondrial inner membrane organizing system component [Sorochytrium milnesiophthora]